MISPKVVVVTWSDPLPTSIAPSSSPRVEDGEPAVTLHESVDGMVDGLATLSGEGSIITISLVVNESEVSTCE